MGSESIKTAASRPVFVALWLLASTVPLLLGYATGDRGVWVVTSPYLLVVAIAIGVLQGLVLERSFGGAIFWKWLAVTVPLVVAAPFIGVAAGVVFIYGLVAADALLRLLMPASGSAFGWAYFVAMAVGLAGGGAPAVLAQWLVLRKRVGRRWLWTLPVPGLTYGTAYLFSRDIGTQPIDIGVLLGTALVLVYAAVTAIVLTSAVPRPATAAVEP
jgi:hypothetical protein